MDSGRIPAPEAAGPRESRLRPGTGSKIGASLDPSRPKPGLDTGGKSRIVSERSARYSWAYGVSVQRSTQGSKASFTPKSSWIHRPAQYVSGDQLLNFLSEDNACLAYINTTTHKTLIAKRDQSIASIA